jgi:hypothetical protein
MPLAALAALVMWSLRDLQGLANTSTQTVKGERGDGEQDRGAHRGQ